MADTSSSYTTDLGRQMKNRIRLHLLVSFGGICAGMVGLALSGGLFGKDPSLRIPLAMSVAASIAVIPMIGFWSTFRYLRCPACEGMVAWQVSANASLFAKQASKKCRHCKQPIFDGSSARFIRNLAIAAVAIGLAAAIVNSITHRH